MSVPSCRFERSGNQIRDLHLRICVEPPATVTHWDAWKWARNHADSLSTTLGERVPYRNISADMLTYRRVHNWAEFVLLAGLK